MSQQLDLKYICKFIATIIIAAVAAYFGQPLIAGNERAADIIVTAFSIFAGFLIAVFTVLGDPTVLLPGSWRIASLQRGEIQKKLMRHKVLFHLYLITLFLIFVSSLFEKTFPVINRWVEMVYLFLGVLGFLGSLSLPKALIEINETRINSAIDARAKGKKS